MNYRVINSLRVLVCSASLACAAQGAEPELVAAESASPVETSVIGGVVQPVRQVDLALNASGILRKGPVEGQMVKQGEVVALLDDRRAKAAFMAAEASLKVAEIGVRAATRNRDDTANLEKDKLLSRSQLAQAEFAVETAQAKVLVAKADLEQARIEVEACQLEATFPGIVVSVNRYPGEFVNAGETVLQLVDLSQLQLKIDIRLEASEGLRTGVSTKIFEDGVPLGTATVKTVMPLVDAASSLRRIIWTVTPEVELLAGRYVFLAPWQQREESKPSVKSLAEEGKGVRPNQE